VAGVGQRPDRAPHRSRDHLDSRRLDTQVGGDHVFFKLSGLGSEPGFFLFRLFSHSITLLLSHSGSTGGDLVSTHHFN
jgi:hypothetical protein